jgi:hypothetical protein
MADARRQMIDSLREVVVPRLRQRGFTGSFPHFRRLRSDRIDVLTFQFDRHGGGFVIEIGQCPPTGIITAWGKPIPAKRVTAWDLDMSLRSRIKAREGSGTDSWFRYDGTSTEGEFRQTAAEVLPHIEQMDQMFDDFGRTRKIGE